MWFKKSPILQVLDECAVAFTFPALDNGYVYPAASRLSVFAAKPDWAIVIEVFGFSPRAGFPDTAVYTFASRLQNRKTEENYVSRAAYENYLARNPNNEFRAFFAIEEGQWQDEDNPELVAAAAREMSVRGQNVALPSREEYERYGISLEDASRVHVYELCRFLSETRREDVLATRDEQRASVLPHLSELLVCDEWYHPDVVGGVMPSKTETFRQIADVLESEDPSRYRPTTEPNSHWSNWPEGGTL